MANLSPTITHVNGAMTRTWTDPDTGVEYGSRRQLESVRRQRRARVLQDFELLVRDKTLGQDPWEQLPGESRVQFNRFHYYLTHAGADGRRSYTKQAAAMSINVNTLEAVARKFHWKLRADCWDRHVDEESLRVYRDEKVKSARRQANLGRKLQLVASEGLTRILDDEERMKDITPTEALKMADVGVKIERLANSDPTDIVDKQHTIIWNGPMPEWAKPRQEATPELDNGKVIEGKVE